MISRLHSYVSSVRSRDPASRSASEILLYPGSWSLLFHGVAHPLFRRDFYLAARFVNHLARFLTAIDIHPGATIGRNLFLNGGFIVIGETADIGDEVTIHSRVTLGGSNPANGVSGKRHPTIGDSVVIDPGAQILGPITVGDHVHISPNSVVTRDVADHAVMAGIPARPIAMGPDDVGDSRQEKRDWEREEASALELALDRLREELERAEARKRIGRHGSIDSRGAALSEGRP